MIQANNKNGCADTRTIENKNTECLAMQVA
jgi:hypothetical protein